MARQTGHLHERIEFDFLHERTGYFLRLGVRCPSYWSDLEGISVSILKQACFCEMYRMELDALGRYPERFQELGNEELRTDCAALLMRVKAVGSNGHGFRFSYTR